MRIIQLLPTMSFGDAVSNDAAAIRQMIREMGHETEIYAGSIDRRLPAGSAVPLRDMKATTEEDALIYHGSTGDLLNLWVPRMKGKKMLIYHNITPPRYFRGYSRKLEEVTGNGYREMKMLAGDFPCAVADSDYNRQDMRRLGFRCPIEVCPIVIPFEDYDREPDPETMDRYRGDGKTNLLFVGRIAPNKKQENVIRAFHHYHRYYNPESRLFLVGSARGTERYLAQLRHYVTALGLEESVVFPGQISFPAILACYRLADVFVCMSEHEGFCVPVVEAMYFGKPIVALRAAAVPETLGKAGLLLEDSNPETAAAAIDRVLRDEGLRAYLKAGREEQLRKYRYEAVSRRMTECIDKFIIRQTY